VHSLGHDLAVAPVSCRPASRCHPDPDAAWPRLGRRRTLRKRVTSRAGGSPRHPRGRNQGSDRSTRIVRRRRQGCGPRWYARAEGTTAWVDFMMRFELGLEQPDPKRALVALHRIVTLRSVRTHARAETGRPARWRPADPPVEQSGAFC
jgi:hypothetical protein